MDYKYIDQLLERYWAAETTLEEEKILAAFFSQADIPAELECHRPLFAYQQAEKAVQMPDEDFENRILAMTEGRMVVSPRRIGLGQRLMPLFRAAAIVAITITIGSAIQKPFNNEAAPGAEQFTPAMQVALGEDSAIIDTMHKASLDNTSATIAIPTGTENKEFTPTE